MTKQYYAAEGFEHFLKIFKQEKVGAVAFEPASNSILTGAPYLLSKLISNAEMIETDSKNRNMLWINYDSAESIVTAHNNFFNTNNTLEHWLEAKLLESQKKDNNAGFILSNAKDAVENALAIYYEELSTSGKADQEIFNLWVSKAHCFWDSAFLSPSFMSIVSRERYLDSALEWLEKNSKEFVIDENLLSQLPKDATPIQCLEWWEATDRIRNRKMEWGPRTFETYIGQIVKYDTRRVAYENRCRRIKSLLNSENPIFIAKATEHILRQHPESIAWLLADHKTLNLGLALIENAIIPEMHPWQMIDSNSRTAKTEMVRSQLWEGAIEVGCYVIESSQLNWDDLDKARSIYHLLSYLHTLELETERQESFRPDLVGPKKTHLIKRRKHFLSSLSQCHVPTKIFNGGQVTSPKSLYGIAKHLISFCSAKKTPSRESFESMPKAELEIIIWLLEEIVNDEKFPNQQELKEKSSETILFLYRNELERTFYGKGEKYQVHWTCEANISSNLNWCLVAKTFFDLGRINDFVAPYDFEEAIRKIPINENMELHEVWSAQQPWAMKIRTHLNLLVKVYDTFKLTSAQEVNYNEICKSLENGITKILVTYNETKPEKGHLDIFDQRYESNTHGITPLRLIPLIGKALNHFSPLNRSRVLESMKEGPQDLNRLIGIAGGLTSVGGKKEIEAIIANMNLEESLKSEHWLTRIEQMAVDSVNYGMVELAKEILRYGDEITENHAYRDRWQEISFQLHLSIAYYDKDADKLKSLPIPDIKESYKHEQPKLQERLENRRHFLLAVLDIEKDPTSAVSSLEKLCNDKNISIDIATNLFRARIEVAKKELSHNERNKKLSVAWNDWNNQKKVALSLLSADQQAKFYETIAYNELEVLILLDNKAQAQEILNNIPNEYRLSIPFLKLIIPFYQNKTMKTELNLLQTEVQDFHRSFNTSDPELIKELESLFQGPIQQGHIPLPYINLTSHQDRFRLMAEWFPGLKVSASPHELVNVLRGNECSLGWFLLKELVAVLHTILDQQALLEQFHIQDEPSQTLFLAILLRQRINEWGWNTIEESQGGRTSNGKTGWRDISIEVPNTGKISIIEALKLTSANQKVLIDHLERLFTYDTVGDKDGFILTFMDVGDPEHFWKRYQKIVNSYTVADCKAIEQLNEIQDKSLYYGSRFRIGTTKHLHKGESKTIYHIVMNVR